ncbi:MAG: M20/M25/M40 family metallo-hydrolase, partial [Eggerthellaceae bacterium]|nr:M20/M25/M40 family metallo-hydrolase [Eggerthellaceae bacterium]
QAVNAVPGVASARVRAEALSGVVAAAPGAISLEQLDDGTVRIEAHGTSAHASTPELGENAIGLLVDFLLDAGIGTAGERAFLELLHELHANSDGSGLGVECADEHFGALTAVGGVIALEAGRICQSIDFRYPTTTSSQVIAERVNEYAQATAPGATFTMQHDKEPFLMNPDSPEARALLDAYRAVTGEDAQGQTSKGGTYARCFTTGVSFGAEKPWVKDPDWVGGMHGPDEGVSEALLKEAFSIYAIAIGNLRNAN